MAETQDQPGPVHAPRTREASIDGVLVEGFPTVAYSHGLLTEVMNSSWNGIFPEPVEHAYVIANGGDDVRDEWYVHHIGTDRYVLLDGAAEVALFDARPDSATHGELLVIALEALGASESGYSGLRIPPGVWHSFRSTGHRVLLMNFKTPAYDRATPDKFRIPMPNESTAFSWADSA